MIRLGKLMFAVEPGPCGCFFCAAIGAGGVLFYSCSNSAADAIGRAVDHAIERGSL